MIKTVSVKDLVARQFFRGELNRYDIFVRYLAVEEYYGKNNYGFRLYEKMQNKRIGDDNYGSYAVERFLALIKSYEVNGYKESSAVLVGKNLALWDGSHRIALGLYHKLPNISIDIQSETTFYEYKIDWFLKNDFSPEEIKIIIDKADEVLKENPIKFTGFLWGPAVPYAEDIFKDIGVFGEVSDVKKFSFKSRAVYNRMLKVIYAIDDIDPAKVDIKAEYLSLYAPEFISFHFKPFALYAHWRVKEISNAPLSLAVERVKSAIKTKYKDRIANYFHDMILHICDNQYQSDYCDCVCSPNIDIKKFLQDISVCKYVLLGMRGNETPYKVENFPEEFPVGKDIDIFVIPEDYNSVVEIAKKFSAQYKNQYETVFITEGNKTRIRFSKNKLLILQIDISFRIEKITDEFVIDSVENREEKDGYYILSPFYEYLYRFQKFRMNPEKVWHLKYLYNHLKDFDEKLAKKYGDFEDIL